MTMPAAAMATTDSTYGPASSGSPSEKPIRLPGSVRLGPATDPRVVDQMTSDMTRPRDPAAALSPAA